jgi:uncharacterized protein YndB with AHSA1/START domain
VGIQSDRRYRFDQPPTAVWDALTQVERYRAWWPWLREFDGTRFVEGERWRCVVKPQLPYVLEFVIHLTEIEARAAATAELSGDIDGWAAITLRDSGGGSELRLASDLSATAGVARLVGRFVPALASIGHDWVLDNGIRQFRARGLA